MKPSSLSIAGFVAAGLLVFCNPVVYGQSGLSLSAKGLPEHSSKKETSIQCGDVETKIRLSDLGSIQHALKAYCYEDNFAHAPADLKEFLESNIKNNQPSIGVDGNARIGAWLLEGRREGPVLSLRPLPPGTFQFLAYLKKNSNTWVVTSFYMQTIHVARE